LLFIDAKTSCKQGLGSTCFSIAIEWRGGGPVKIELL
jgi:hypothetical protein